MIKAILRQLLLVGILSVMLQSLAYSEGLKKWLDEKGQVHYGDRVPAQYLRKEHSELNSQGVIVHTTQALKTEIEESEEKKRQAIQLEIKKAQMIKARKQMLRDRVLLDTFTTEKDLVIARDARIEALDSQISLAKTLISHDTTKLQGIKKRIKRIRDSKREPPENLLKSERSVSRQLENNHSYIKEKSAERSEILRVFDEDVKRFRELKAKKATVPRK
ncbi:hypothetical protein MNBD_GAMMA09-3340 [hydrothermal vent metagenome]|uniref:DUF4124 domain-containing protein n=1 Tax=hydrothermal vent metagenome TaxID=652676 RepID=A0A3B0Y4I4_9ZZZZ